jgi:hypothetical protein
MPYDMRAVATIGRWPVSMDNASSAQRGGRLRTAACFFCFFLLEILARSAHGLQAKLPQASCVSGCEFLFVRLDYRIPTSGQRHFGAMVPMGNAIRTVQDPVQRFTTLHLTLHSILPC